MEEQVNYSPMPEAQNQSAQATQNQTEKPPRRGLKITIVAVISTIVIAGIAFGGWAAYDKFIANTPEKIMQKMFLKITEIKSFAFDGNAGVTADKPDTELLEASGAFVPPEFLENEQLDIKTDLSGSFDFKNANDIKLALQAELEFNGKKVLDVQAMLIENTLYIKANEIYYPEGEKEFFDFSKITGHWIKIDLPIDINDFESENPEKSAAIKKIIMEEGYKIFTITNYFGVEKINGEKNYHLALQYNEEGLLEITKKIANIIDEDYEEDYIKALEEGEYLKDADYTIEVWINKKDYSLEKIKFSGTYSSQENGNVEQYNNAEVYNFNKIPGLVAPNDYLTVEEVMSVLMEQSMSAFENENVDFGTMNLDDDLMWGDENVDYEQDSDGDGLTDFEEEFVWETDPNNTDTNGDGYNDAEEIENGYNPNGEGKLF